MPAFFPLAEPLLLLALAALLRLALI